MVSRPLAIPLLPLFLRRPIADAFLTETEFPELRRKALHFHAIRVILGEEAFFEKQELVFGAGAVVDDGDEEPPEINLDPCEQLGERRGVEFPVVMEGELARVKMDLDEVGLAGIAIKAGGALDIDAEDGR